MRDRNPLIKNDGAISLFGFKVWCDTCIRIRCETRRKYTAIWEETGRFEEAKIS